MKKLVLVISSVIVSFTFFTGCGYNQIQMNEEEVKAAWGDVQAAYQRRADLIPNLVNVVKGYATHEKETLTAVIEARSKATSIQLTPQMLADPNALKQFQGAQDTLTNALSKLMVIQEQYPNLKADQTFMDLQHQLEGTENRINVARQRYNETVKKFNISIRTFPNSITNSILLKLELKQPFAASEGSEKAPEVKF